MEKHQGDSNAWSTHIYGEIWKIVTKLSTNYIDLIYLSENTHSDPMPLIYISRSSDFVVILRRP